MITQRLNQYGQPIGEEIPGWTPRKQPPRSAITGSYCRVEPLSVNHAPDLYDAIHLSPDDRDQTYLLNGPFHDKQEYTSFIEQCSKSNDPLYYAVVDLKTGRAVGVLSYLRIDLNFGAIEVGHIHFSKLLKQKRAATEVQYLLMQRAFDELGYRRYE